MKIQRHARDVTGYTLMELMVVIAISSTLLLIATNQIKDLHQRVLDWTNATRWATYIDHKATSLSMKMRYQSHEHQTRFNCTDLFSRSHETATESQTVGQPVRVNSRTSDDSEGCTWEIRLWRKEQVLSLTEDAWPRQPVSWFDKAEAGEVNQ